MTAPKGSIKEVGFESHELDETLNLLIYTPAMFSPLNKYSLLIVQDGKDYFQMGRLPRYADELLDNGEIENLIIIGIHYQSIQDRRDKYHPQGKQQKAYIRFLANELVPWLDKEYPTSCMGKCRTLMGDSLAATVSLMAAVRYPNTFGKLILHSPYVNGEVLDAVKTSSNLGVLEVYHAIGKEEDHVEISDIKDFLTPNRELHNLFKEKGVHTHYQEFSGGHSWKYWQPLVNDALLKMFAE